MKFFGMEVGPHHDPTLPDGGESALREAKIANARKTVEKAQADVDIASEEERADRERTLESAKQDLQRIENDQSEDQDQIAA